MQEAARHNPQDWMQQSAMSSLGDFAAPLRLFRSEQVPQLVQGWFLHCDWLDSYGVKNSDLQSVSRTTLPVHERLNDLARSNTPLHVARALSERQAGTCRDYALATCALLRNLDIPARVRCGFASYFGSGWEDHWICESYDEQSGHWLKLDAQLDEVIAKSLKLNFTPPTVPDETFKPAGEAWLECRTHHSDPAQFGHGNARGLWFMAVNVVRDHLAMNDIVTSPWDGWRAALKGKPQELPLPLSELDSLATRPAQRPTNLSPFFE